MSGLVSVDAGYTVSVRRTRLSVFVLLTVALLAGESPTYIRHEKGIHISLHAQSKYRTQLAKLRFDKKKNLVDLTQLMKKCTCIFSFFLIFLVHAFLFSYYSSFLFLFLLLHLLQLVWCDAFRVLSFARVLIAVALHQIIDSQITLLAVIAMCIMSVSFSPLFVTNV